MRYPKFSEFIKFLYGSVFCIFCKGLYYKLYNMEFVCNNSNTNYDKKTYETEQTLEKKVENIVREHVNKETNSSTTDLNKNYVIIDKKKEKDDNEKKDDTTDSKKSNDEINACSYYMLGDWLQKNQ